MEIGRSVRTLNAVTVRTVRSEGLIAAAMCLILPGFAVGTALLLGAPGPTLVFAALSGGAIGVAWARKSWSAMIDQVVDATIERDAVQAQLDDTITGIAFRDRVDQSLRASTSESATIEIMLRAVAEVLPDSDVSMLLNLPNESKVGWRVELAGGTLRAAVPVPGTPTCLAFTSLSTIITPSSTAIDACEHLRSSGDESDAPGANASTCVPLRLGDRTLGAVNAQCAPGQPPTQSAIERIEWTVSASAVRIAEKRLQRGPSHAGTTDPVTGLPGQPAMRNQVKDLIRTLVPFCLAIVSVDRFEEIRYGEGDEAAEIALGFVADALTSTLRPDDFVSRIGESSFGVVLADCGSRQATAVIERTRESLALLLALESETVFTCSAGVVESHQGTSIDELMSMAMTAAEQAAAAGGNRVQLAFEADHL